MTAAGARGASKAEFVYGELKQAILTGALEPGGPIDKPALCARLGVSRFPISAAISRLAYDGLVVIEPQHGSFVSRISVEDVRERLFIRVGLESAVAAEAARRMPKAGLEALRENLDRQEKAIGNEDLTHFYALDVAFHQLLVASLGLRHCRDILDGLRAHLERARRMMLTPVGRVRATFEEHAAIFEAIGRGDPEGASSAMGVHLGQTSSVFERIARERPALFSNAANGDE